MNEKPSKSKWVWFMVAPLSFEESHLRVRNFQSGRGV